MFFKKKNYFSNLCTFMMLMGVFLGLNSMYWLMMWMSMEITLMFFIPKLILNKSIIESFSSLKYFIFQALGSIFFILGSMDMYIMYLFGLFLKLGLFPNHFWMLSLSKGLNWLSFLYIMTIQKVLPMLFLVYSLNTILYLFMFIFFFNSLISNLGSLNQMDLRLLMTFSSMNHMTWMIMSSNMNMMYFYLYFVFYTMLMFFLFKCMHNINIFFFFQIFYIKNYSFNYYLILIMLIFFSFLGFPPLLGFFMKFISLLSMMNSFLIFYLLMVLLFNLIISFSYMRVIIFMMFNLSRSTKYNKLFMNTYIYLMTLIFFFFII